MESEAKYTLVGATVLALTAFVVFSALWFTRKDISDEGKYYTIYFHEQDLSGLAESSVVTMRGINVGKVTSIRISKRNIEHVRVNIVVRPETPVKTDAEAIIKRNLLTGLASIDLVNGTNDAPLLIDVGPDEKYPVIAEGKSELERIASSMPDLLAKVESSVSRINALLSEENIKSTSETLDNIRRISSSIADSDQDIRRMIKRSADLADHADKRLDNISVSLTDSVDRISRALEDFGRQGASTTKSVQASAAVIAQQIAELSQKIADAANNISATALQYQDPRSIITGPSKSALGPGESKH
jgi:phospholipid/cholesterol/gamma-HCH transport system substrate-binding protein